jgi:hypothetical protein
MEGRGALVSPRARAPRTIRMCSPGRVASWRDWGGVGEMDARSNGEDQRAP